MNIEAPVRRFVDEAAPRSVISWSVVAAGVVAATDYATGPDLSFSLFYLIPVAILSWRFGKTAAIASSSLAAFVWFLIDVASNPDRHIAYPIWNAVIRSGFFLTVGALLIGLRSAMRREMESARLDVLTGLPNRRAFVDMVSRELARSDRSGTTVTIALVDVDEFKAINDAGGHSQGDAALVKIGHAISASVRVSDLAARLGGDEFALMLLCDGDEARRILDRITEAVANLDFMGRFLGCSIGATSAIGGSVDAALERADVALYRAKAAGKGRFEVA